MALSNHSIGILISRVVGIQILVGAIGYFSSVGFLPTPSLLIAFFLHLGLAYILLLRAPLVAEFLMSETTPPKHDTPLSIEKVTTVAFIIIGVSLLIRTVPELVGTLVLHPLAEFRGNVLGGFVQQILKIALALWLTVAAKGIAVFIEGVRSGHPKV